MQTKSHLAPRRFLLGPSDCAELQKHRRAFLPGGLRFAAADRPASFQEILREI